MGVRTSTPKVSGETVLEGSCERLAYRIANLHYSGINSSPYQFFKGQPSSDLQQRSLDQGFIKILQRYRSETQASGAFGWSCANLDKHWHRRRYSPLYEPLCGIKDNIFVMDRQDFVQEWLCRYEQCKETISQIYGSLPKQSQEVCPLKNELEGRNTQQIWPEGKPVDQFSDFSKEEGSSRSFLELKVMDNILHSRPAAFETSLNCWASKKIEITEKNRGGSRLSGTVCQKTGPKSTEQRGEQLQQDLNQLMEFDYMVFEAIIDYLYGKQATPNSQSVQLAPKLRKFSLNNFRKTFLCEKSKLHKFSQTLIRNEFDIVFLTEVSEYFVEHFNRELGKAYRIVIAKGAVKDPKLTRNQCIVIRKSAFPGLSRFDLENDLEIQKSFCAEQLEDREKKISEFIKLISDSKQFLVQFIGYLILVCPHLYKMESSDQFRGFISLLQNRFPCHTIIAGGRLNCNFEWDSQFSVFPDHRKQATCFQCRTHMQLQLQKAGKVEKSTKDYIVSNGFLTEMKVGVCPGKDIDNPKSQKHSIQAYLPKNSHPFASYLNEGVVELISHDRTWHEHNHKETRKKNKNLLNILRSAVNHTVPQHS